MCTEDWGDGFVANYAFSAFPAKQTSDVLAFKERVMNHYFLSTVAKDGYIWVPNTAIPPYTIICATHPGALVGFDYETNNPVCGEVRFN